MTLKRAFVLIIGCCFALGISGRNLSAASSSPQSSGDNVPGTAGITRQVPVKDEVKILRNERIKKMPYLDKALIRAEITPQKVAAKQRFVAASQAKNLKDITQRAVELYTPARSARERISLSRRRIWAAVRALFPQATMEIETKAGKLSGDKYNSGNYRFNFRQAIFHGGILWNTLLQEKANLEAAEKEYTSVIEDLVKDVISAYLEYSRAVQVVKNQAEVIREMQKYAALSKRKYGEGIVSEIENLNTQSLFSQMEYDNETSKQELELAKLDLQRYLDLGIDDNLDIVPLYHIDELIERQKAEGEEDNPSSPSTALAPERSYPADNGKPMPKLGDLVDLAYQHRAALQVESAKLEAARLQERIRWGEIMPKGDLIFEVGRLGEAFDTDTLTPSRRPEVRVGFEFNWNVGGNKVGYTYDHDNRAPSVSQFLSGQGSRLRSNKFSVGLLDGLSEYATIKEAEVARLDQITQLEKAEKEVVHDVKQSFFDYQKSRIRVKSSLQRVAYRRRLASFNKHKLEKNEIQISEYLQSEIDALQEIDNLQKALSDFYTAKAKLNHSIGMRGYFPLEESYGNHSAGK